LCSDYTEWEVDKDVEADFWLNAGAGRAELSTCRSLLRAGLASPALAKRRANIFPRTRPIIRSLQSSNKHHRRQQRRSSTVSVVERRDAPGRLPDGGVLSSAEAPRDPPVNPPHHTPPPLERIGSSAMWTSIPTSLRLIFSLTRPKGQLHGNTNREMSSQPHQRGGRGGGGRGDHRGRGGGRGGQSSEGRGGHAGGEREKSKKENILDLGKYMDKQITVKFTGGREGEP
jgi:hypothetical protein